MGKNGKTYIFSSVAATLEKASTWVFAERLIRNAEVRGSTPLCSTNRINDYGQGGDPSMTTDRAATLPFSFVTDSSLGPIGLARF
jgi:hypothetical protein